MRYLDGENYDQLSYILLVKLYSFIPKIKCFLYVLLLLQEEKMLKTSFTGISKIHANGNSLFKRPVSCPIYLTVVLDRLFKLLKRHKTYFSIVLSPSVL